MLTRLHAEDLYLAQACDLRLEGAWDALDDDLSQALDERLERMGVPSL